MADTDIEFSLTRRGRKVNADVGLSEWADQLSEGLTIAGSQLPPQMRAYLTEVVNTLAAKHGNKWPGGTGSGSLSSRTGDLLSSLRAGIAVQGTTINDLRGSLGGNDYLQIQEYGGTVLPRGTQYLAIPLPAALNSDGTPIKDSPRDWDKTFVQMSKAGNLLIFRRDGASIVPLYALKTSVTLPPRLGARQVAKDKMPYFRSRVLDNVLKSFTK